MWCHQSFNHLIDFRDNLIATLFNLWNFETEEAVGRKAEHVYYMVPLCWCLINKLMCLCHVYIRLNGLCDVFVFFVSEYVHLQFCAVAWLWLKQCLNYHLDTLHLHSTWKNMLSLYITILYGIQIILVFRIIFQRHLLWSRTGVLGNCGPFTVWVSKLCYAATFPQHRRCNVLMTWGKRYSVSVFSERNNGKKPVVVGVASDLFWRVAKWSRVGSWEGSNVI